MLKYTILYKNGKTWNGKANNLADVPVHNDAVLLVAKNSAGSIIYMIGQYGGWSSVPTTFRRAKRRTPNPNSKTKKQKEFDEAFRRWKREQYEWYGEFLDLKDYKKWLYERKKMEWLQPFLATKPPLLDKDGFIPWAGGECPVQKDNKVVVKFRNGGSYLDTASVFCWYEMGSYGDIVGYKAVEEQPTVPVTPAEPYPYTVGSELEVMYQNELRKITCVAVNSFDSQWMLQPKQPIKTTYTFWLGANGEIVDDK